MMLSLMLLLWERNGWRNACGRFTASTEMMDLLSDNPKLGHHHFGDTLSLRQPV
jgi:hypothetical protein